MAIGTSNLTLANFLLDCLPTEVTHHPADVAALLSSNMIEVEAAGVCFPTVHAGMKFEIVQKPFPLCGNDPGSPVDCFADVIILVGVIVQSNLLPGAISTLGVAL